MRHARVVASSKQHLLLVGQAKVGVNHQLHQFIKRDAGLPAKRAASFLGCAQQKVNLCRTKIARIDFNKIAVIEIESAKCFLAKLSHRMRFIGSDNLVVWLILLQHKPHCFDIVAGKTPVTLGVEVAQVEPFL